MTPQVEVLYLESTDWDSELLTRATEPVCTGADEISSSQAVKTQMNTLESPVQILVELSSWWL